MKTLTASEILLIHEDVIFANELQGLAKDKSLDSVVSWVENRIRFGFIKDIADLAASYAVLISTNQIFIDANRRTAYLAMAVCLQLNGVNPDFDVEIISQITENVANGKMDEIELAKYLRTRFI